MPPCEAVSSHNARFRRSPERLARQWKFYGAKHGWQVKVSDGKRAIVYLIPRSGRFTAAMALRDAAIQAARASGLPPALVEQAARVVVTGAAQAKRVLRSQALRLES